MERQTFFDPFSSCCNSRHFLKNTINTMLLGREFGDIFARAIVLHMAVDKVASRQSRHQRELCGKNSTGDNGG